MEGRDGEAERGGYERGGRGGERTGGMERFCERVLYGEMRWGVRKGEGKIDGEICVI